MAVIVPQWRNWPVLLWMHWLRLLRKRVEQGWLVEIAEDDWVSSGQYYSGRMVASL